MSILAEVLTSIQEVSEEEIESKIPKLNEEIRTLLHETLSYSENVYVSYLESPVRNANIIDSCQQISEELESLKNSMKYATRKDLGKTPRKTISDSTYLLDEMQSKLCFSSALAEINVLFIEQDDRLELHDFVKCKKIIHKLDEIIQTLPKDEYNQLYCGILNNIFDRKSLLEMKVRKSFHDCLNIQVDRNSSTSTFIVTKNCDILKLILDAVVFDSPDKVHSLDNVIELLWELFFLPIFERKVVNLEANENIKYYELRIVTRSSQDQGNDEIIIDNLLVLLKFLQTHLSLNFGENFTCLQYIGRNIQVRLDKKLLECCCLNMLIGLKTLQDFELNKLKITARITKLDEILKHCQIFDSNKQLLQDYINNIDLLYMKEKCSIYNEQALNIMKKDFLGYTQVNFLDKLDAAVCQNLSVSRNVRDLMQFCESIMEEAVTSSMELNAGMLFTTIQLIIKMYGRFIPKYHEKMFPANPLFVALFHNNCLYIESILTDWNERLCVKLPGCHSCSKFTTENHQLKRDASKVFVEFIENELTQINVMLSECERSTKTTEQCIEKLEILHATCFNILPNNIADQSIGKMVDALCISIINWIIKADKLTGEDLNNLRTITKMTMSRCLKLFTKADEINLYVESWHKLCETDLILNSNLLEIKHRWANGKTTLAKHFKRKNIGEFTNMLRAIFWESKDEAAKMLSDIVGYV